MEPVTIVTTVQFFLIGWVMSIAFFVSMALVAIVSKGRRWYEILGMFAVGFLLLSLVGVVGTQWIFGVHMIEVDFISLGVKAF